jgi:hypothetical protein
VDPRTGLNAVAKTEKKIPSLLLSGIEPGRPAHNLVFMLTDITDRKVLCTFNSIQGTVSADSMQCE